MGNHVLPLVSEATVIVGIGLLLESAAKGLIVMLGVMAVTFAMRRSSAAMRHLIWSAGMLSLLVIPIATLCVPHWEVLPTWLRSESLVRYLDSFSGRQTPLERSSNRDGVLKGGEPSMLNSPANGNANPMSAALTVLDGVENTRINNTLTEAGNTESAPAKKAIWVVVCFWAWSGITACLLARILLSRLVLARLVRKSSPVDSTSEIARRLHRIQRHYNLRSEIYVYLSDQRRLPMTWGIFRIHLVLPSDAKRWPGTRLEAVLLHELAHVKRYDTMTHVIEQSVCAVYWFNPMVWFAAWRIHVERESACDDMVVSGGMKPSDYAEQLLLIIGRSKQRSVVPSAAVGMAKASRLDARLMSILNDRLNRRPATKRFLALVMALSCVSVFSVAMLRAQSPVVDQKSETERTSAAEARATPLTGENATSEETAAGSLHVQQFVQHLNRFLVGVKTKNVDEMVRLAGPPVSRRQLEELSELADERLKVQTIHASPREMLAVSSPLKVDDAGGERLGRLLLHWEYVAVPVADRGDEENEERSATEATESSKRVWQLRDIDFESDRSLEKEIAEFTNQFPDARRIEIALTTSRRFVRLVIGPKEQMTFEGHATTWRDLPKLLAELPDRSKTVLEFAISSEQLTVAELKELKFRAVVLARDHGLEYASYVGVHPLHSTGSRAEVHSESTTIMNDQVLSKVLDELWLPLLKKRPVVLLDHEGEAFDAVAKLAEMTATEASELDTLLRGEEFASFDALQAYDPSRFSGDVRKLMAALDKLFVLYRRQQSILKRIESLLEQGNVADAQRDAYQYVANSIRQQHAAQVLSIRQVFRQFPKSGKRANWTALANRSFGNERRFMAIARSPVGGEFPIRFEGEEAERFRVRVLAGDDDVLTIKVSAPDNVDSTEAEDTRSDGRPFELARGVSHEIVVKGNRYSLLYPNVFVARSGPATTDLAQIVVSCQRDDSSVD